MTAGGFRGLSDDLSRCTAVDWSIGLEDMLIPLTLCLSLFLVDE